MFRRWLKIYTSIRGMISNFSSSQDQHCRHQLSSYPTRQSTPPLQVQLPSLSPVVTHSKENDEKSGEILTAVARIYYDRHFHFLFPHNLSYSNVFYTHEHSAWPVGSMKHPEPETVIYPPPHLPSRSLLHIPNAHHLQFE